MRFYACALLIFLPAFTIAHEATKSGNLMVTVASTADNSSTDFKMLSAAVEVFNRYTVGHGGITTRDNKKAQSDDGSTTIWRLDACVYGMEVYPPYERHLDIIDFAALSGRYSWDTNQGLLGSGNRVHLVFEGTKERARCFAIGNGSACTADLEINMDRYFFKQTIDDVSYIIKNCSGKPD